MNVRRGGLTSVRPPLRAKSAVARRRLDELQVELDLDDVAEHRCRHGRHQAEVLSTDLTVHHVGCQHVGIAIGVAGVDRGHLDGGDDRRRLVCWIPADAATPAVFDGLTRDVPVSPAHLRLVGDP